MAELVIKIRDETQSTKAAVVRSMDDIKKSASGVESSMNSLAKNSATSMNGITNAIKSVRNQILALFGLRTLIRAGMGFVQAAQEIEDYKTSIRAVSKTVEEADGAFQRIKTWAEINPINTDDAIAAYVRLKTAAVGNTEEALKSIADLATVMHTSTASVANALVTTETESLRRYGIILNREGKQATIQFGETILTVNKDIASVRQGIVDVLTKSVGGAMQKAGDTFSGTLATMGGLWTKFKTDVMDGAGGPFENIKEQLRGVRDEWERFTSSTEYQSLISNIQGGVVSALNAATSAAHGLADAIKMCSDNASLLKAAIAGFVFYKGELMAMSAVTALMSTNFGAWISLMPSALSSLKEFVAWIGMAKVAVGGLVGIAAIAVFIGYWSELAQKERMAAEAAKIAKEEIDKVDTSMRNASASEIEKELLIVEKRLVKVAQAANTAQQEIINLSTAKFTERNGILGGSVGSAAAAFTTSKEALVAKSQSEELIRLKARQKELQKLYDEKTVIPTSSESGGTTNSDKGKTKSGKSAAELYAESVNDQIKYMNANGESFLPVLDKWLSKLKPLSKDWKTIKDLQIQIIEDAEKRNPMSAANVLERNKEQIASLKSLKEQSKQLRAEYYSNLEWQNSQGMMSNADYLSVVKDRFKELYDQVQATGVSMENIQQWPKELQDAFSAVQTAASNDLSPALDLIKKQYDNGTLSLGDYKTALEALMQQYSKYPAVVKSIQEQIKAVDMTTLSFTDSLRAMLSNSQKDFNDLGITIAGGVVDSLARAAVYSDNLGDSLKKLGQDILYTVLKMTLLQQITNMFSGFFGGGSSFSASQTNSYAYLSNMEAGTFANGGVFSGPGISAYSGSVVSAPTVFPFARGVGLMGEAGAEAIMPLQRNNRGELGVKVAQGTESGGTVFSPTINVTVNNSGDSGNMTDKQAKEMGKTIQQTVDIRIMEKLSECQRMGYFKNAYGR